MSIKTYINPDTNVEWIEIEVAENQFTAMPKSVYDEQQANADKGTIS